MAHSHTAPLYFDAASGNSLACLAFTTGNPAVETVHGWIYTLDDIDNSHSTITAAAGDAESKPSAAGGSVFAKVDEDEKWHRVKSRRPTLPSVSSPLSTASTPRISPISPRNFTLSSHALTPSHRPSDISVDMSSLTLSTSEDEKSDHKAKESAGDAPIYLIPSPAFMLLMCDIPSHVTIPEIYDFLADHAEYIEQVQMVLPAAVSPSATASTAANSANTYMLLIAARSLPALVSMIENYHKKTFNDIEKVACYLKQIHSIQFHSPLTVFPYTINDSDLPVCPVCLEFIHPPSNHTLLIILCYHLFHFECLSKWTDSTCPVCRYNLHPTLSSKCSDAECDCYDSQSLWLCLLCGHIGCSRYVSGHAFQHWSDTGHGYAMSLATQRAWDYVSDQYVHRLVQATNKIIDTTHTHTDKSVADPLSLKLEDLLIEYNYLLSSQLEKQRVYYQSQLTAIERENASKSESYQLMISANNSAVNQLNNQLLEWSEHADDQTNHKNELENQFKDVNAQLNELKKENKYLLLEKVKKEEEIKKENELRIENEALAVRARDDQIAQLEEELKDLMFYLRTQKQVSSASNRTEIQEGTIIVAQPTAPGNDEKKTAASQSSSGGSQQRSKTKRGSKR